MSQPIEVVELLHESSGQRCRQRGQDTVYSAWQILSCRVAGPRSIVFELDQRGTVRPITVVRHYGEDEMPLDLPLPGAMFLMAIDGTTRIVSRGDYVDNFVKVVETADRQSAPAPAPLPEVTRIMGEALQEVMAAAPGQFRSGQVSTQLGQAVITVGVTKLSQLD